METVLARDRKIVIAGLAVICVMAWLYLFYLASGMRPEMGREMAGPSMQAWGAPDLLFLFFMWTVMMAGMMIPSASPMTVLYAGTCRQRRQASPLLPTAVFVLGYLAVWTAFSAAATLSQWGLHAAALLSPMMRSTSSLLGGALLIAAGIFQWTPLKYRCLSRCRSPLGFLLNEWRDGTCGAFVMGLRHGLFCLGCCWALMGLLFVTGVMNLLWVAAIAFFVLVEKVAPGGKWVSRGAGGVLVVWGIWLML